MTPRKLKPYKVDEVTDRRLAVTVTIYFDRERKVFFGTMPGDGARYEDKDIDLAKSAVRAAIPKHHGMTWQQVISIRVGDTEYGFGRRSERTMCNLEFDYERFEIGKAPVGDKWLEREFRTPGESRPHVLERWERKEDVENHYVHPARRTSLVDEHEFEIPYSDEAWAAIKAIEARTQLLDMFRRPDLAKQLSAIGSKFTLALPAHGDKP